ncbi:MAG: hypothetical protein KDH95_22945 [Calditrichaeota bacterium]|nr:hypothetical protein [Calditrichota bacterium]MCB0271036.1 hypothetical protein [Calditrichota bacterium]
MIYPIYYRYLTLLFYEQWAKIYRQHKSKRARQKTLSANDYMVNAVSKKLQELPIFLYPERDSLYAFAENLFEETSRIPRNRQQPPDDAFRILNNTRLRKMIECLTLMKYLPHQISDILQNNDILNAPDEAGITAYIEWFFNINGLSETDRNMFFTKAQDVPYFSLHSSIFWGTVDYQIVMTALDLVVEEPPLLDSIKNTIRMFLNQLRNAAVLDNHSDIKTFSQAISHLAGTYARMTIGNETEQPSLADLVKIVEPEDDKYSLTLEDIRRHNQIVQKYGDAKDFPRFNDSPTDIDETTDEL